MDEFACGHVIGMMESGQFQVNVAEANGIVQYTFSRQQQHPISRGNASRNPVESSPRITALPVDRFVALMTRRNETMAATVIAAELNATPQSQSNYFATHAFLVPSSEMADLICLKEL